MRVLKVSEACSGAVMPDGLVYLQFEPGSFVRPSAIDWHWMLPHRAGQSQFEKRNKMTTTITNKLNTGFPDA